MSVRRVDREVSSRATIQRAELVPGHDGEGELLVEIRYESGASVQLILDTIALTQVLTAAGVSRASDLIGKNWSDCTAREQASTIGDKNG